MTDFTDLIDYYDDLGELSFDLIYNLPNPPENYNSWSAGSKLELKQQMINRLLQGFGGINPPTPNDPVQTKIDKTKQFYQDQHKNFSNTKAKHLRSIYTKQNNNKKLNRTELKTMNSILFTRAHAIRKQSNLTFTEALKFARETF